MFRFTLRYKLLGYSVVLAIVPLALAGTQMIRITQDELKSSANDKIVSTARKVAKDIDAIFAEIWLSPLKLVASGIDSKSLGPEAKMALLQSGIRNIVDIAACQLSVEGFQQPLRVTRDEIAQRLVAAGLEPGVVLAVPPERLAKLRGKHDRMSFGELRYIADADIWLLPVVLPLNNRIAGRQATLAAVLNLDRLRRYVDNHAFQKTGTITLVGADGRKLFDPARTDLSALAIVADAMVRLDSESRAIGVRPYRRPTGQSMLAGYAFPHNAHLAVVVEHDEKAAYVAVDKMRKNLLYWVVVGIGIATIGGVVVAHQISGPVEDIDAVARQVGEGNFDVRAREIKSSDEIGELGRRINLMIDGLVERERVKGENVQLRELNETLNRLNDEKNKLLGMVAHDLRNPIGVIVGCSEMILEEEGLDEESKTLVQNIESTSKFMLRLLNDLLDLSQIESGKLELHRATTDIASLIRQNVELNRIIAKRKNIRVQYTCADNIPDLIVDPGKIEQVLNNLISNAIKFSFPGTVVRVTAEKKAEEVPIAVADEGQGIPPDEVEKIFQPFEKTSVKSTAGEKSSGLGLSIVKKFVEGHLGHIRVASQVGKGTTFYLSLPIECRDERIKICFSIEFSVTEAGEGGRVGLGTTVDLSESGAQIESTLPLRVGDEIRFAFQLPQQAPVIGTGELVWQIPPSRFGIRFVAFEDDGAYQVRQFLAAQGKARSA